jgi:hypothetical protein
MEDTAHDYSKKLEVKVTIISIFIVTTQAINGFYGIYDEKPPGTFVLMNSFGLFWLVGDWFMKDSKVNNVEWAFDMGFFLYLFWPIFIPFYLFKTRGLKKTVIITLSFVSLYFGAYFVSGFMLALFFAGVTN